MINTVLSWLLFIMSKIRVRKKNWEFVFSLLWNHTQEAFFKFPALRCFLLAQIHQNITVLLGATICCSSSVTLYRFVWSKARVCVVCVVCVVKPLSCVLSRGLTLNDHTETWTLLYRQWFVSVLGLRSTEGSVVRIMQIGFLTIT